MTLAGLQDRANREGVTLKPQHSPRRKQVHPPNPDVCVTGPGTLETQRFKDILRVI